MAQYWGLRGRKMHAAVWTISCFAVMIFGYNQGSAGNVVNLASFYNQFPQMNTVTTTGSQQHSNATIQGTVIALYTLFGTFGALGCTFLGDYLGRRRTIWLACFIQSIGCILMGTSFQFAQFIVARIILGLGTGGIIATVSVWQSELSKASSRGGHVSAFGIFCGFGLVVVLWLEFGMSFVESSASWRFPLAFPLVFAAIVMAFILTLPESPRWLVKVNRLQEAEDVLSRVHDTDPQSDAVQGEIREIQTALELAGTVSLSSMFKMGPTRVFHRVCLACVVQIFLQLSGTNAVSYYTTTIFQSELGFTPTLAYILSACLQFMLILGSLVCSFTVDRYGRRTLLMLSASLSSLSMACLAGATSNPNNPDALKAGVFFIYFFQISFTLGFLGIPFLYASEIAPVQMRAAVCGISTAVSWLFNFMVAEVTPIAFTSIGFRYFIVYAATNAAAVPVIYFFFPETSGRSLEELDEIFISSSSIFDTVRVSKRLKKRTLSTFVAQDLKLDSAQHIELAEQLSTNGKIG